MGDTQRSDREKQSKGDTFLGKRIWSGHQNIFIHFCPEHFIHSLAIPPPNLEEMQRKTNFHFQLKMLILLAITLLPFKLCQIQHQFRNESSPSLPIPLKLANSPPSTIRLKRQYPFPPSGQSACGGCPSKFTPVNCKCSSTQNDELICRCDRAILANLREEPDRPQCPCRRGISIAGDLNNFRGEITELTSRVQNLGGINSACHPICHQSCLNSCIRPIGREIDSYRDRQDRYGPMATNTNDVPNHQQSSPSSSSVQHQYPLEQIPGCQPSLCRTNCLRACSRILDGQKGAGGDFGDPRGPSTDPYQENLGSGIEPPTHYEVRPVDPYLGKIPSPEYPQLMGKNEGPTSSGGNCQCSPGAFCDCPETCFPICFDSCDANCNSNNQAQGQNQRRICAQSCHYECQRNCAEKQRQKQQQMGGNELGMNNNNNPTNNVDGGWTPSPPQIADNNDSDGEFQQGNNGIGNNQQAAMPTNCLAKCPKSCETACSMTNEDPTNCVPACVSICAQSCARGLNQFDANSGQSPQIPNLQFQSQQFQQNIEGNLQQQQQAQLRQQLMEGLERSKMQSMPAIQMPIMNGGGRGMIFPFEMNSFKNGSEMAGGQESGQQQQQMGQKSQLPPTMFLNDGLGNNAARGMTFSQPCAPLCQPACTPECNRRYMEERRGQQRLYRGIGGQYGNANSNPQQQSNRISGINGGGNEQTFNGQLESKPGHIFPPHYILPLADDLDLANGTVDDFLVEGSKQMDDDLELEALLRPQNETGNSTQIPGKKEGTKIREEKQRTVKPETTLTSAKPWKGGKVAKNGGMKMEEFFKRRMGKLMKLGDKKAMMKGEQIAMGNEQQSNNNNNKWPLGEEGGKGKMAPKLNYS